MSPGYLGRNDDLIDEKSSNKHSALSGNDYLGDLPGEDVEEDLRLEGELWDFLQGHTEIDTSRVDLFVKDYFVSLTGSVDSEQSRATVVALVEGFPGVQDVASYLRVDSPVDRQSSGDANFRF